MPSPTRTASEFPSIETKLEPLEDPPAAIEFVVNIIVPVNARRPRAMYCEACRRRGGKTAGALMRIPLRGAY
jgi:hypothetical protein